MELRARLKVARWVVGRAAAPPAIHSESRAPLGSIFAPCCEDRHGLAARRGAFGVQALACPGDGAPEPLKGEPQTACGLRSIFMLRGEQSSRGLVPKPLGNVHFPEAVLRLAPRPRSKTSSTRHSQVKLGNEEGTVVSQPPRRRRGIGPFGEWASRPTRPAKRPTFPRAMLSALVVTQRLLLKVFSTFLLKPACNHVSRSSEFSPLTDLLQTSIHMNEDFIHFFSCVRPHQAP